MNNFGYSKIRASLLEDFNEFVNEHAYTKEQAIGALLEDSVLMMRKNSDNYISVIVVLSVISLQNNFIDDFICERSEKIFKEYLEEYKYRLLSEFLIDKAYLEERLCRHNYTVIHDSSFKTRVDLLLDKK